MKQILFILLAFFSFSCEKEETKKETTNPKIEFYELLNFNDVYIDSTGDINMSRAILKEKPIIENTDIISYNSIEHTILFTKEGKEKISTFLNDPTNLGVLLLKVNGEGVFATAYFKLYDSSNPAKGIVYLNIVEGDICAFSYEPNEDFPKNKDKRNNEKLKKVLEASGRLK